MNTSSGATEVTLLPRIRPGKLLRGSNTSVSNINVYRHGSSALSAFPAPSGENANRVDDKTPWIRDVVQRIYRSVDRVHVVLGISASLCIIATLAAISGFKLTDTDEVQTGQNIQNQNEVASSDQPYPISPNIAPAATPPPAITVPISPESLQTDELVQLSKKNEELTASYLDEINNLITENVELKRKVKVLTEESIGLNEELLALELDDAARIRVIYNFVNDPSQAPENDNSNYYSNAVEQQDELSANDGGNLQYDEQLQYDQNYHNEQYGLGEEPSDLNYEQEQYEQNLQQNPDYQNEIGYVFEYDVEASEEDYNQN